MLIAFIINRCVGNNDVCATMLEAYVIGEWRNRVMESIHRLENAHMIFGAYSSEGVSHLNLDFHFMCAAASSKC